MTPSDQNTNAVIDPAPTLIGEDGMENCWLAAAYSEADIRSEWDYLFEDGAKLYVTWFRPRPTTSEELANEDVLYDLFGDWEMTGVLTDVVYDRAKPNASGAHRYFTTEPSWADSAAASDEERHRG